MVEAGLARQMPDCQLSVALGQFFHFISFYQGGVAVPQGSRAANARCTECWRVNMARNVVNALGHDTLSAPIASVYVWPQ